jgi:hypothetical protein
MADLSQADLDYYNKVVQQPEDFNINDLRRAYYIGVLGGEITPGGPLSTFEQYIYDQIITPGNPLHDSIQSAAPPGPVGPQGAVGPEGPIGPVGPGIVIKGTVATYAALPPGLGTSNAGDAYIVTADNKIYIWDGSAYPANGNGMAAVVGPAGPVGPQGTQGNPGAQGIPGAVGPAGPAGPIGPAGSGIINAPGTWPATFPSSPHSHTTTDISNSTPVGRAVLTAVDQQTARAAIGAGTGNGTSNLALGPASTQAAAGNHTHAASNISFAPTTSNPANDVQTAIANLGAGGGGTGAGNVRVVKYASGQYPAFPVSKPAGVDLYVMKGPVFPTTVNIAGGLPLYLGDGPTQIMTDFEYRALT